MVGAPTVGEVLRAARLRLGLQVRQVASAMGWSHAMQSRLEHGHAALPGRRVGELAAVLGLDRLELRQHVLREHAGHRQRL